MQNTTVGIDSIIFALAIRHCAAWLNIHGPKPMQFYISRYSLTVCLFLLLVLLCCYCQGLRSVEEWKDIVGARYNTADRAKKEKLDTQVCYSLLLNNLHYATTSPSLPPSLPAFLPLALLPHFLPLALPLPPSFPPLAPLAPWRFSRVIERRRG